MEGLYYDFRILRLVTKNIFIEGPTHKNDLQCNSMNVSSEENLINSWGEIECRRLIANCVLWGSHSLSFVFITESFTKGRASCEKKMATNYSARSLFNERSDCHIIFLKERPSINIMGIPIKINLYRFLQKVTHLKSTSKKLFSLLFCPSLQSSGKIIHL